MWFNYKFIDVGAECLIEPTVIYFSGVSGEGCGVIVEGFAPAEAVATPPTEDSKACLFSLIFYFDLVSWAI